MNPAAQTVKFRNLFPLLFHQALIWGPFVIGLGWLVIRPIGLHFSVMPGNYGDTRLINYILEHFFRWVSGLEPHYWSARFFYPFPLALAFSDNLLGSAPFYAAFRVLGFNRELSLQIWFILGFTLNFLAAAFVLRRFAFHPLAVGLGAFFFTFGLPMLAQIGHLQLLYRFCVPLAAYLLWQFANTPRWWKLAAVFLLTLWQLWISVYIGVFLVLLLLVMVVLMPFFQPSRSERRSRIALWPNALDAAWKHAAVPGKLLLLGSALSLAAGALALFLPYVEVTRLYNFNRGWPEVMTMLPRPQSYFIADHAAHWRPISRLFMGVTMRHEHQMFLGLSVFALLLTGLLLRFQNRHRRLALYSLAVVAVFVLLTLVIGDFSLYRVLWMIPGMDSIRSVTRIQLVWMWPLAVFLAFTIDGLLEDSRKRPALLALAGLMIAGLFLEPFAFTYWQRYSTRHARERVAEIRAKLPTDLPQDPILFLADKPDESEVVSEVDAMLLAQELGWPTLNGYSGNHPPGYQPAHSCIELPRRILNYMEFSGTKDEAVYRALMERVVPVGFTDCDPAWWQSAPAGSTLE